MADRLFASVNTHLGVHAGTQAAKAAPDSVFRILFIGDFSGRASRGIADPSRLAQVRPQLIDRDNIDEIIAKLGCQLRLRPLGEGSQAITVDVGSLEDFHPDNLYRNLGVFESLRDLRRRLADPKTFAQAKAELKPRAAAAPSTSESTTGQPPVDGASLLDQMLDESPNAAAALPAERGWKALLVELMAPHVVAAADPMQSELLGNLDAAVGVLMRAILHDSRFQALEAAWRSLALAVSAVETGSDLKLYLLDVTRDELAADLGASGELEATGWHKLLVTQAAEAFDGEGWALVAADYSFDDSVADVATLDRAGRVAEAAGAPFLATASPRLLGCASLARTPDPDDWTQVPESGSPWNTLRHAPHAAYLGLALPRILLRMPYGKLTDKVESFDFEEANEGWRHESYLWGSPAFACALLLARTFSVAGWDISGALERDIEGLPMHVYRDGDEKVVKPCAEIRLSERAADRMIDCGLMPLASIKDEDRVRLVRLQSIAVERTALAGRWR